jgi:hypothetical protein
VSGSFAAEAALPRVATEADRQRSTAQDHVARGIELREQRTEARQKAIAEYERAIELWQAVDEPRATAETFVAMALALYDGGENQRMLGIASRARALFKSLGDDRGEGAAADAMGLAELMRWSTTNIPNYPGSSSRSSIGAARPKTGS